jgi:hypothetical protein
VLAKGGRFRLAHSGDVKVYENLDVLPRAFVVPQAHFAANDDDALTIMQGADFDPSQWVVLTGAPVDRRDAVSRFTLHSSRITRYDPEHIVLEVTTDSPGYLVLTDAWYPGWAATVDGQPVEVLRADVYFRALSIGAGEHRVEFRYEPRTFQIGAAISVGAWVIALAALIASAGRRRS